MDELAKWKNERDDVVDKLEKWGLLVVEFREAVSRAKKLAVDEFKFSLEFLGAVEDSASKYFGEGFDFYKRQLRRRHHPDLAINLEDMGLDHDLLSEEDKDEEGEGEGEGEGENANIEDKGNTDSPSFLIFF